MEQIFRRAIEANFRGQVERVEGREVTEHPNQVADINPIARGFNPVIAGSSSFKLTPVRGGSELSESDLHRLATAIQQHLDREDIAYAGQIVKRRGEPHAFVLLNRLGN